MISRYIKKLFTPSLGKILTKTRKQGGKRFLVAWNRGLGDIPLGLYAFIDRVRQYVPEAEITFITRPNLEDAFRLLDGVGVIVVPTWEREDGSPTVPVIRKTLERIDINYRLYDVILDRVDPTGELKDCWGKLTPRLKWREEYNNLWRRFNLHSPSRICIGVHVDTETHQFYGNKKDWPIENWEMLFEKFYNTNVRVILFGLKSTHLFDHPSIIDLRGKTSLLEMLSIIKNCCNMLIAPDGGVLSIAYYLDVYFPIAVISLWGDSNQGILKQAVPSPNTGLKHFPIIGKGKDVTNISVDEVFSIFCSLQQEELLP